MNIKAHIITALILSVLGVICYNIMNWVITYGIIDWNTILPKLLNLKIQKDVGIFFILIAMLLNLIYTFFSILLMYIKATKYIRNGGRDTNNKPNSNT